MSSRLHRHRRSLRTRLSAWAVLGVLVTAPAAAQLSLDGSILGGGGGRSESAGGCLVLDGTLGEPVTGTASGGAFALRAGFTARIDTSARDRLFNTGFEECQ
jgi:hypothetical protein